MGCLSACFRNRRRKITASKCQCSSNSPQYQSLLQSQEVNDAATKSITAEQIVNPVSESGLKNEPLPQLIGVSTDVSIVKKHVDAVINIMNDNLVLKDATEAEKQCEKSRDESSNSDLPTLEARATNHSHQDLRVGDKECVDVNSKNITSDAFKLVSVEESCVELEESSESLFSLSIDSRRQVHGTEAEVGEKEVMSPFQPPPADIKTIVISSNSVDKRNPEIKCEEENKENVNVNSSRIKWECDQFKSVDNGIAADTSLSSWLVESHKSTKKVNDSPESEKNYENRQMLEEIIPLKLKHLNGDSSSALSTPSCPADSQPSVGTVGSYWLR